MSKQNAYLHVAVGVIENNNNEILISKRHLHKDQGGLWEFPGGKLKSYETVSQALIREINEELDIKVISKRPLIKIKHDYPDYSVLLDVWKIDSWSGEVKGCEGQDILWLNKNLLDPTQFPAANIPIISAINLPALYFITPDPALYDEDLFMSRLEDILKSGCKLMQFRSKQKPANCYKQLIDKITIICNQYKTSLIINAEPTVVANIEFDGLHLTSKLLLEQQQRPVNNQKLLSASCHNEQEINKAIEIDVDVILLGPVKVTNTHPESKGIGWERFNEFVESVNLPVYALGGMTLDDLQDCWSHGGQGLAMISGFWNRTEEPLNKAIHGLSESEN